MKGTSRKPYNKYNCNGNSGFDSSDQTQLKGSLSKLDNRALPSIPENNFNIDLPNGSSRQTLLLIYLI